MRIIHLENPAKHFQLLHLPPGLGAAVRDLFSSDYRYVKAVDGISLDFGPGRIISSKGPTGAGS